MSRSSTRCSRSASRARRSASRRSTSTSARTCSSTTTCSTSSARSSTRSAAACSRATTSARRSSSGSTRSSRTSSMAHTDSNFPEEWDLDGLFAGLHPGLPGLVRRATALGAASELDREELITRCIADAHLAYERKEKELSETEGLDAGHHAPARALLPAAGRSTRTGASTSTRWTTCARASTCARWPRRTRSSSTASRATRCSSEMMGGVREEVVSMLFHVEVTAQDAELERHERGAADLRATARPTPSTAARARRPRRSRQPGRRGSSSSTVARAGQRRAGDRAQRPVPLRLGAEVQALPRARRVDALAEPSSKPRPRS